MARNAHVLLHVVTSHRLLALYQAVCHCAVFHSEKSSCSAVKYIYCMAIAQEFQTVPTTTPMRNSGPVFATHVMNDRQRGLGRRTSPCQQNPSAKARDGHCQAFNMIHDACCMCCNTGCPRKRGALSAQIMLKHPSGKAVWGSVAVTVYTPRG